VITEKKINEKVVQFFEVLTKFFVRLEEKISKIIAVFFCMMHAA